MLEVPSTAQESAADNEITLGVLSTVSADAHVSQRYMARELGVALGLANAYLKRCVRKGFIKVQQVPRHRYAYYLTPQGFAEKARLTGEYLAFSLVFFRQAREQISSLLQGCTDNGWQRVVFIGVSELAEIGTLCAHDVDVKLLGIVDAGTDRKQFCGLKVVERLKDLGEVDAVIITAMRDGDALIERHCKSLAADRVLAPRILRLAPLVRQIEESKT